MLSKLPRRILNDNSMEKLLTLDEVATTLKVHENTILRIIKKAEISAIKVGGQWRITTDDLCEYLEKRTVKAKKLKQTIF